ncbi:MAG: hypothetical protein ACRD2A_23705, partial [Vicinamibacterales bacterium]
MHRIPLLKNLHQMFRLPALFALALCSTLTIGAVSASGTADMKVSPPSQTVLDGTSFTSSVLQNATVTTTGAQTNISFNMALVQITTVQAGAAYSGASFLMGVAPQTHQEAINEANTTGTLRNVSVFFNPGAGSVPPGETTFVQVNMQAKPNVEGTSPMTLANYEMLDNASDTVTVTPFNGSVSVCLDNTDGDALCNSADSDDDNDGVADTREVACGSDPLDVTPPLSRPERVDGVFSGVDDGDTLTDEALPGGAINTDCDGDGYRGSAENHVFQYLPGTPTNGDQKVCQEYDSTFPNSAPHVRPSKRWPSDVASGAFSGNKINVQDLSSFISPIRYLNTNVGTNPNDVRFDIVPGSVTGAHIN